MADASDGRFDPRGCLTPLGLDVLRRAPVGAAPVEVAQHLAACPRCQNRFLVADNPGHEGRPARRPQPLRTAIVLLAVLLVAALAFLTMYMRLVGRR